MTPNGDIKPTDTDLMRLLAGMRRGVGFTGAGISTESGIPDFRSPGGLWSRHRPIEFADFLGSREMRDEAWRRRLALENTFAQARPARGHEALAQLVASGRLSAIVTQNIDGLHQMAGVPADRVVELHGNTTYATCLDCGKRYELAWVRARFESVGGHAPDCTSCSGPIKSAAVSFGQPMPRAAMTRARELTRRCDVFLAIGSSLSVWPAARFPVEAKRNGAALVIINREPTALDDIADLVIRDEIGPTLEAATYFH